MFMELKDFLLMTKKEKREAFLEGCGVTLGHLRNIYVGTKKPSAELAVRIEKCSDGLVKRESLRPDLFSK